MENKIRKIIKEQIKKLNEQVFDSKGERLSGIALANLRSLESLKNHSSVTFKGDAPYEDRTFQKQADNEDADKFVFRNEKGVIVSPEDLAQYQFGGAKSGKLMNNPLKEQIKKLSEMKVTDKDGKDVTSDVIKAMEKRLEKQGYKFTKGYTSDPDLRKDDPRYTKAEGEEEFTPDLEKDDLQRKAIKQMMDKEKEKAEFDAEQDEWDKGWYGESLKELASELGYLEEEGMYIDDDEWEEEMGRDPKFGGLPMAPKKSDDEGPDHGKLRTSPSGTKFRVWDKKTDMMGNPRGSTRKDRNAWGFPKKK